MALTALLAHRYGHTEADLQALMGQVQKLLGPGDRVVLGREDHDFFKNQTKEKGVAWSWNLWATSIPERYQVVIVVTDGAMLVGRPTAVMISTALAVGCHVVVLAVDPHTNAPMLLRVTGVVDTENGNYKRVTVTGF